MPQGAPSGNLQTALSHAAKLLDKDPVMAEQQAREILKVVPGVPGARHILAVSKRMQGEPAAAVELFEALSNDVPNIPSILHQLGLSYGAAGQSEAALNALRKVVALDPEPAIFDALTTALRAINSSKHHPPALEFALLALADAGHPIELPSTPVEGQLYQFSPDSGDFRPVPAAAPPEAVDPNWLVRARTLAALNQAIAAGNAPSAAAPQHVDSARAVRFLAAWTGFRTGRAPDSAAYLADILETGGKLPRF